MGTWTYPLESSPVKWCLVHRRGVFHVDSKHQSMFCYRRKGQRFEPNVIYQVTNRGYGSVSIWGGIFGCIKTPLVRINGRLTSDTYIRDILQVHVVPFTERHRLTLMQDNAPTHSACVTMAYLQDHNGNCMPWSAVFPYLRPIENACAIMHRELRQRPQALNSS